MSGTLTHPDEDSVDHLEHMIYGYAVDELAPILRAMGKEDLSIVPLAIRFISTGTEVAQSMTRAVLDNALDDARIALAKGETLSSGSRILFLKRDMTIAWTLGNTMEETGLEWNPRYLTNDIIDVDQFLYGYGTLGERSTDENYWRALGMIVMTNQSLTDDRNNEVMEFARWAGKQQDAPRIINLATERKTLNVGTLSALMVEQDRSTVPLLEGTL